MFTSPNAYVGGNKYIYGNVHEGAGSEVHRLQYLWNATPSGGMVYNPIETASQCTMSSFVMYNL